MGIFPVLIFMYIVAFLINHFIAFLDDLTGDVQNDIQPVEVVNIADFSRK